MCAYTFKYISIFAFSLHPLAVTVQPSDKGILLLSSVKHSASFFWYLIFIERAHLSVNILAYIESIKCLDADLWY